MIKDELLADLAQLTTPTPMAAQAYTAESQRMATKVTTLLNTRVDLDTLIGKGNRELMARNHRHHALFMADLFANYSAERLLDTLLWVIPAYQSHGFRLRYWEVQLDAWQTVLPEYLGPAAAQQITPFYRWIRTHLTSLEALGWQEFEPDELAGEQLLASTEHTLIHATNLLKIIHATPLALCITNEQGIFEYVNPAYCMLYGYAPTELRGQHFTMIVPAEARAQLSDLHARFLQEGSEIRGEWTVLDREGLPRTILADATRITGADGKPRKVTFVMDISKRKQAEQVREDVERLMRHELKAPLNAIINIPRLLLDDDNLTPEQVDLLKDAEHAGLRMLKTINFSLELYKLETGTYQLQGQQVDLLSIAARALGDVRHDVTKQSVACQLLQDGQPVDSTASFSLCSEDALCYNLLANLIKNAVEASPPGQTVTVDIQTGTSQITIEIHNWGCIPEAIRANFFDKYATHGKQSGTGLGTYAAKLIAETLGGSISFQTDETQGTTLWVSLPRYECNSDE